MKTPWKTKKLNPSQKSDTATTMYLSADLLRICSQLLSPVMPEKTQQILSMLGAKNIIINDHSTGLLKPGHSL